MDDTPYLSRGAKHVTTTSSVLVSSSKYLNHPVIREYVVTENLRRNGQDLPFTYMIPGLIKALVELQDKARIDELFAEARRDWPALDAFFVDRRLSGMTMERLSKLPNESIGRRLYRLMIARGFDLELFPAYDTKSDYDFWKLRSAQYHDLHHLLFGATFDHLGEVSSIFGRLSSYTKFFVPELAAELNVLSTFVMMSLIPRTQLYYPQCVPTLWRDIERGMRIGRESDAWFLAPYDDYLHLSPVEIRAVIGLRGVEEFDTTEESVGWGEGRAY